MNLFVLSDQPREAARMLCDAHIIRTVADAARVMVTVYRWYRVPVWAQNDADSAKLEHPVVHWVMRRKANYQWFAEHSLEAAREYNRRFNKTPMPVAVVAYLHAAPYAMDPGPLTNFTQHVPEAYRVPLDAVAAYRAYYLGELMHFARWRHGQTPNWVPEHYRR